MRGWLVAPALAALASAFLMLAPATLAKPLEPLLQQQLLAIYDAYNRAILAGTVAEALKLRTAEVRASAEKEMPTAAARQRFLGMARMMVPDTVEAVHGTLDAAGDKATIITDVAKAIPKDQKIKGGPAPGSTLRSEVTLTFVREGGGWTFEDQMFGPDPTSITTCKDESYEPEAAYDTDKTVSMGGRIVRVDFEPDHTLVVIRVVDEDNCAFLRDGKDGLLKHGLAPDKLVPFAVVEIDGSPHRKDKLKVLVDSLTVTAAE